MKYLIGLLLSVLAASSYAQDSLSATAPNGAVVTLTQDKGPCQGPAKLATHISPDKKTTTFGCWKINENAPVVTVVWLDADVSTIPAQVFKPKAGV